MKPKPLLKKQGGMTCRMLRRLTGGKLAGVHSPPHPTRTHRTTQQRRMTESLASTSRSGELREKDTELHVGDTGKSLSGNHSNSLDIAPDVQRKRQGVRPKTVTKTVNSMSGAFLIIKKLLIIGLLHLKEKSGHCTEATGAKKMKYYFKRISLKTTQGEGSLRREIKRQEESSEERLGPSDIASVERRTRGKKVSWRACEGRGGTARM